MIKTAVVVLNWQGYYDTYRCLSALMDARLTVYCVDNGSLDSSGTRLRAAFPELQHIQNSSNLGFAGGMNQGLKRALADGADVVVVLNNDALAEPSDILALAVEVFGFNRAVCPLIQFDPPRREPWFQGTVLDRRLGRVVHVPYPLPVSQGGRIPSETLTGCCLAASNDVWERVGLFDEDMFLIWEDTDWSWRARRAGVELYVHAPVSIRHRVSSSLNRSSIGEYFFARNNVTLARRFEQVSIGAVIRAHLRDAIRSRDVRRAILRCVGLLHGCAGTPTGRASRRLERFAGAR